MRAAPCRAATDPCASRSPAAIPGSPMRTGSTPRATPRASGSSAGWAPRTRWKFPSPGSSLRADPEKPREVVAHDREHLLLVEAAELRRDVVARECKPLRVREVRSEHDRLDPDLVDHAPDVLLGKRRNDEVVAEDLAGAPVELAE